MGRTKRLSDESEFEFGEEGEAFSEGEEAVEDDFESLFGEKGGEASLEAHRSAERLVSHLIEEHLLLLSGPPSSILIERVARVIDSEAPLSRKASRLAEIFLESDEVDELFAEDKILSELLSRL
ncbi:MAG: hypothetical protein NZM37_06405 [Sandaracinaceae bacterium]|nr:hypothetical protein [Sandaracinaceae bacterium]MDW8246621.1 hypothetical protein [Sandaracinaceae bacterium]